MKDNYNDDIGKVITDYYEDLEINMSPTKVEEVLAIGEIPGSQSNLKEIAFTADVVLPYPALNH